MGLLVGTLAIELVLLEQIELAVIELHILVELGVWDRLMLFLVFFGFLCFLAYLGNRFAVFLHGLLDLNAFFRAVDQRLYRKCCAGKGEADQQNKKDELYFNVLHACLSFSLVA